MTPSFTGRTAWMWPGGRPIIRLASTPPATGRPSRVLTATTEGSLRTIPRPRTYTTVLAVPRSTAMSRPINEEKELLGTMTQRPPPGGRATRPGYVVPPNHAGGGLRSRSPGPTPAVGPTQLARSDITPTSGGV